MSRSDNVQRILGAIGPFFANWGLGRVPRSPCFFCVVIQTTFRQLHNGRFSPNLAMKRISVSHRGIRKIFLKIFTLEVICPQNLKPEIGQTGTSLRAGYSHRMHCRDILFTHIAVQGPRSFRVLVSFSVRRTVAELQGVKVAQFSDFGLFFPYKTPKTYLPVTSLQLRGYIAEWFRFFAMAVEGPKGCLPAAEFSCDFW